MLKLKLQYSGHLMWRVDSMEKTLMLEGIGGRRRRGWQRMRGWMASLTQWTWVWVDSGNWWWTGRPGVLQFMGSQKVRHDWVTELNRSETEQPPVHLFSWLPLIHLLGDASLSLTETTKSSCIKSRGKQQVSAKQNLGCHLEMQRKGSAGRDF